MLSPILFSIYVGEMIRTSYNTITIKYVDDMLILESPTKDQASFM